MQRRAHLLVAVHDFDRGGVGRRSAAACAALEDSDLVAGGQRNLAPGGGDIHSAACQPARADGRICQHHDLQHRRVGHGNRDDRADLGSHVHGAVPAKRATATLMVKTASDVAPTPKRMLTLRRKEVSLESPYRDRVPQPYYQDAASCHSRFAWPGYAGRGEPARKAGLDAAAEARRRDYGRERALGTEAAPAADGRAPFGSAVGANYDRNLRPAENRSADALCVFGGKLAAAQNGDRLPDGAASRISPQGESAPSEE